MPQPTDLARVLIFVGIAIAVIGVLMLLAGRFGWTGHLPGDFVFRGKNWSIWLPVVSSIVLSIILTILLNVFRR